MSSRVLAVVAVLAFAPQAAAAPESAPPTPGCLGSNFSDPAGDARDRDRALDVTGGFLTSTADGLRLNLRVVDLDLSAPEGYKGKSYVVRYRAGGSRFQVTAWMQQETVHFEARDSRGFSFDVGGRIWEGESGIVQYELPGGTGAKSIEVGDIVTTADRFPETEFVPDETPLRVSYDKAGGSAQPTACPEPPPPAASTSPTGSPGGETPAAPPSRPEPRPPGEVRDDSDTGDATGAGARLRVLSPLVTLSRRRDARIRVQCTADPGRRCSGRMRLTATTKARGRRLLLAARSVDLGAGRATTLRMRVRRAALRRLGTRRELSVRLTTRLGAQASQRSSLRLRRSR